MIFMIIRPMVTLRFMADLPRARFVSPVPGAAREDAQIVSVSRDGQIFYRNVKVRIGDLPEQIRESIRNGAAGRFMSEPMLAQGMAISDRFWMKSGRQAYKMSASLLRKSRRRNSLFHGFDVPRLRQGCARVFGR